METSSRDDRLTVRFSDHFSGYTAGGDFLVKDREEWVKITRRDFSQVTGRIRIELLDLVMQDVIDDVVVVTALSAAFDVRGPLYLAFDLVRIGQADEASVIT